MNTKQRTQEIQREKRTCAVLMGILVICLMVLSSLPAEAAVKSAQANGVSVTASTDREVYTAGQAMTVDVSVTNNNDVPVTNVSIDLPCPIGFGPGSTGESMILGSLQPGETSCGSFSFTAVQINQNNITNITNNIDNSTHVSVNQTQNNTTYNRTETFVYHWIPEPVRRVVYSEPPKGARNTYTRGVNGVVRPPVVKTGDSKEALMWEITLGAGILALILLLVFHRKSRRGLDLMLAGAVLLAAVGGAARTEAYDGGVVNLSLLTTVNSVHSSAEVSVYFTLENDDPEDEESIPEESETPENEESIPEESEIPENGESTPEEGEGPETEEGIPEEGIPEEGIPEEGIPEEGIPEEGIPEEGEGSETEEGIPEEGIPEEGEGSETEEGIPEEGEGSETEEGIPEEGEGPETEEGIPEEGIPEEGEGPETEEGIPEEGEGPETEEGIPEEDGNPEDTEQIPWDGNSDDPWLLEPIGPVEEEQIPDDGTVQEPEIVTDFVDQDNQPTDDYGYDEDYNEDVYDGYNPEEYAWYGEAEPADDGGDAYDEYDGYEDGSQDAYDEYNGYEDGSQDTYDEYNGYEDGSQDTYDEYNGYEDGSQDTYSEPASPYYIAGDPRGSIQSLQAQAAYMTSDEARSAMNTLLSVCRDNGDIQSYSDDGSSWTVIMNDGSAETFSLDGGTGSEDGGYEENYDDYGGDEGSYDDWNDDSYDFGW